MRYTHLIIIVLLLIQNIGLCQSEKNDIKLSVSGLPLFSSSTGSNSGFVGMVIKPAVGSLISDRTSIELNFSFASFRNLKIDKIAAKYYSFAIVPTLRTNIVNNEKIRFFGEVGAGLGTIVYTPLYFVYSSDTFEELNGGIFVLNIGIGMNYYFTEKFGAEIIIPYIRTDNITSASTGNLYSGLGPTIGISYRIN